MKKLLFLVLALLIGANSCLAQNMGSPVSLMDSAIKVLAGDLGKKLNAEKAGKIAIGQIVYRESLSPLGFYWTNQLSEELANIPNKSFIILYGDASGADWTISGEVMEMPDTIRVYTRLIRSSDRTIGAVFHSDFERSEALVQMLSPEDSRGGHRSAYVPADAHEPDSMDNPVLYEAGANENVSAINRTIHDRNDKDFFLLIPSSDGRLVMETTGGDVDTYIRFYNAETREKLSENDDGGSGSNARIRYNVQAGRRYIAEVSGYDEDETGAYGFRAYITVPVTLARDEFEPDDTSSQAKWINIGTPQRHNFHDGDDEDWVKFQISRPGRYTIRARGVNSNRLDTNIELYDAKLNSLDEDDDGGENYDSRLSVRLESGLYYLKVTCLDSEPDQPYTLSIEAE